MQVYIQALVQFLKKHYEKIILCVVLLGLGATLVWSGAAMHDINTGDDGSGPAGRPKPLVPLDLTTDMQALALITNPPPVVLSGEHNLFNPVTWRRKPNGELIKILKTGPDALTILDIHPLYMTIAFDHPSGSGGVYVLKVQQRSGRALPVYSKVGEKKKSVPYVITGIKGAQDDPTDLILDIPDTGESNVDLTKSNPYKTVDGHTVDMRYEPESHTLKNLKLNDSFTLDNEPYKIVEITNNLIRVKTIDNDKITPVPFTASPVGH